MLIATLESSLTAQDKVSLQFPWKHQFQFAGYYIAKEKGFYNEVDLDVELREHKGGQPLDEVLSNKATYGIGRSSIIIDIANGKKIKMLFAIFQSSPSVFIATKESGITNVDEFSGKRIMLTKDVSQSVALQAYLSKNEQSLSKMQVQEHSYRIESLIKGETDLMSCYISNEPYLLKEKGVEITVFDPKEEGVDFYSDILFTSSKELTTNKKRATNFANASLLGWKYAFENIDETVDLILKKYNTQGKSREALLYEAKVLKELAYYKNAKLGELNKTKLQRVYDIYNIMGLIKNNIEVDKLLHTKTDAVISDAEKEYLKKKKVITMCIDPDWMPFEKLENDTYTGMSSDFFKLFRKKIPANIKLIETQNWDESLEYAKSRKCDIISLSMKTPSRDKYLNFTEPYVDIPLVIATKLDVAFISSYYELEGKKIGMTKGFAFVELLRSKYPFLEVVEVESTKDGLEKVAKEELFGFIGSLADIGYIFQKDHIGELKIAGKLDGKWELGVGVRNDDLQLLSIFDKVVKSVDFKTKQMIQNNWITINYEKRVDYTLIGQIISLFMLIIGIVLFFYMKQKKLYKIIEKQASTDSLTGLYNRRYFVEITKHLLDSLRREKRDASVLMIDIDNFKSINDTYGHSTGDKVICMVCNILKNDTRESDVSARWGGEEFLVLLPETDIKGAFTLAQKIRKNIEKEVLKIQKIKSVQVTISAGISLVDSATETSLELAIDRADKALYKAKESGRNQVCEYLS